jgi:predicted HTH domain antitoxin
MTTVQIEVPDRLAKPFIDVEALRREIYEDFVLGMRQRGDISIGEAAELLGVTKRGAIELLGKKGLALINADPEDTAEGRERLVSARPTAR